MNCLYDVYANATTTHLFHVGCLYAESGFDALAKAREKFGVNVFVRRRQLSAIA